MFRIRHADQHDFDACVEALPQRWRTGPVLARLGVQLYKDYVIVAFDEHDTLVGFVACDADFFDNDAFYLRTLVVSERHQRKGVATALVEWATTWAFSRGVRRVFADVADDNLGRKLTETFEFEKVGEIRHMHSEDATYTIYATKRFDQTAFAKKVSG